MTRTRKTPNLRAVREILECPVCGVSDDTHPKCRDCWIGIGPGHLEPCLQDGLCGNCTWLAQKVRR